MKKLLLVIGLCLFIATAVLFFIFIQIKLNQKGEVKVPYGTFTIAGTNSQIELGDDNVLIIRNYDMSVLEKDTYEDATIALKNDGRKEDDKLTGEEEQEIRDTIDLNGQFLDRENMFFRITEEDFVGIYVPVNHCDLFLYLQLNIKDKTILFNGSTFSLEKG